MKKFYIVIGVLFVGATTVLLFRRPVEQVRPVVTSPGTSAERHPQHFQATVPLRQATPKTERDVFADTITVMGMDGRQPNETLAGFGANTTDKQERMNELLERTNAMILASVAQFGVVTREPGQAKIYGLLPEATHKMIQAQFYKGVRAILGEKQFAVFQEQRGDRYFANTLLEFGENPITITVDRRSAVMPAGKTRLTFSTQLTEPASFFFQTVDLDPALLASSFPMIQDKL